MPNQTNDLELITDVCIAGAPAINGQCGDETCVCYNEELNDAINARLDKWIPE